MKENGALPSRRHGCGSAGGLALPAGWFNQSNNYFGVVGGLLGLGVAVRKSSPALRRTFLIGAGLFSFSLFLRTIDQAVCPTLPCGTHFVWHLLNGALLYLLVRGALLYSSRA